MNNQRYPWLTDLSSPQSDEVIRKLRIQYERTGAVTFPEFITRTALSTCVQEARKQEESAFVSDGMHTAHLLKKDSSFPINSVRNYEMRTQVASIAFDELSDGSELASLYQNPILRKLVARIVRKDKLYLSEDPLGCCSINVFRPQHHHSFHFDESEFSITLMLQEAAIEGTGLFQYTHPLRSNSDDLALGPVAAVLRKHDDKVNENDICEDWHACPNLFTLDFLPGTLSIFSGSRSLHRVTRVEGDQSRLVAVLTFSSEPGFRNSADVQRLFWGRST